MRNTDTARLTSASAHLSGLPFSAVITSAISSARAASTRDTCSSAPARTGAWVLRCSFATDTAAATARSTCSGPGTATVATSLPSYGWCTTRVVAPGSGRPAIQAGRGSGVIMSMRTNVIRVRDSPPDPHPDGSRLDEHLLRFAVRHRAVAVRHALDVGGPVENATGLVLAVEDVRQQFGDVVPRGGDTAGD